MLKDSNVFGLSNALRSLRAAVGSLSDSYLAFGRAVLIEELGVLVIVSLTTKISTRAPNAPIPAVAAAATPNVRT